MDKKQRLEELHQILRDSNQEYDFDKIYALLQTEISSEKEQGIDRRDNPYLNNLEITKDKQASEYTTALMRKPKGNHSSLYNSFISHFEQDITEELRRL